MSLLGKCTVLCHGAFDVIHAGHLAHLKAARRFGNYLIVSITTDRFINKGPGRPHFSHGVRAEMIRALRIVDEVVISDSPTAVGVIEQIRPDFYVKGSDYANGEFDIAEEQAAVEACGGKLVFTDEMTSSSSKLINQFLSPWTPKQQCIIDGVREIGGLGAVQAALEEIAKLTVTVAGECIMDIYRYVEPQGISSKSPSLSVRYLRTEASQGGSWAIAAHLADFCTVSHLRSGVTHTKTRYISGNQRLFEVCDHPTERKPPDFASGDILLCADFGHGYFVDLDRWASKCDWLALNVQTNSSNFGFNRLKRWPHYSYLVADTREVQLHAGSRGNPWELALAEQQRSGYTAALTCGPDGSVLFTPERIQECPAFADAVVDATGAGDAFFAITTPLVRIGANPLLTSFIGNVFAGLKTRINGNSRPVTKAMLLKAVAAILK